MLKAYKLSCSLKVSSSEVLYNCLTAGEPYIAYGVSSFLLRENHSLLTQRCKVPSDRRMNAVTSVSTNVKVLGFYQLIDHVESSRQIQNLLLLSHVLSADGYAIEKRALLR